MPVGRRKGNKTFFGYKLHTKVCGLTKLIMQIYTTPANVHDAKVIEPLLTSNDQAKKVYADAGYVGAAQKANNRVKSSSDAESNAYSGSSKTLCTVLFRAT